MKQNEIITSGIGHGLGVTVQLKEQSHSTVRQMPLLGIQVAGEEGEDGASYSPAQSLMLYNKAVRDLYDVLHTYYNQDDTTT